MGHPAPLRRTRKTASPGRPAESAIEPHEPAQKPSRVGVVTKTLPTVNLGHQARAIPNSRTRRIGETMPTRAERGSSDASASGTKPTPTNPTDQPSQTNPRATNLYQKAIYDEPKRSITLPHEFDPGPGETNPMARTSVAVVLPSGGSNPTSPVRSNLVVIAQAKRTQCQPRVGGRSSRPCRRRPSDEEMRPTSTAPKPFRRPGESDSIFRTLTSVEARSPREQYRFCDGGDNRLFGPISMDSRSPDRAASVKFARNPTGVIPSRGSAAPRRRGRSGAGWRPRGGSPRG